MKKLMLAAAIVCAAAMSEAASVSWQSKSVYVPVLNTAGDKYLSANSSARLVKAYVFEFASAADMAAYTADASKILSDWQANGGLYAASDTEKANKIIAVTGSSGSTGGITVDGKKNYAEDAYGFAAVLYTFGGTDDAPQYYYATTVATETEVGTGTTRGNILVTSNSDVSAWQSVPEPTSGLLMLLGVAGLALRRRRA